MTTRIDSPRKLPTLSMSLSHKTKQAIYTYVAYKATFRDCRENYVDYTVQAILLGRNGLYTYLEDIGFAWVGTQWHQTVGKGLVYTRGMKI